MNRFRNFLPLVAVLAGAAVLGAPSQANATFTMRLQSGASDLLITDNDDNDSNPLLGQIGYDLAFGDFDNVNSQAAASNSASGFVPAQLSLTNLDITTNQAGASLTVTLEDTAFTAPAPGPASLLSELSNIQTPVGGTTVTFQSFLNGSPGTLITQTTTSGNVVTDPATVDTSPYTLSNVTTITVSAFTGDFASINTTGITEVSPAVVPAPAGIVLALVGAPSLGLGWLLRRRRKTSGLPLKS